jgi:hypothetical protein
MYIPFSVRVNDISQLLETNSYKHISISLKSPPPRFGHQVAVIFRVDSCVLVLVTNAVIVTTLFGW